MQYYNSTCQHERDTPSIGYEFVIIEVNRILYRDTDFKISVKFEFIIVLLSHGDVFVTKYEALC